MAKDVKVDTVRAAENCVRDVKNWLAVFKTEYDVADEAVKILNQKLNEIGSSMAGIKCTAKGVEASSVRPVANTVRDAKAWLAVFGKEYDLSEEAMKVLHQNFDKLGDALKAIECK